MRYHIEMNNGHEFFVTTISPIDIETLGTVRWYSFRLDDDRLVYLNIAQISSIKVIG